MKTVAIDVGGPFTDCLVLDELGELREFKAPSTPPDYVVGVLDSLEKAANHFGASLPKFLGEIGVIVHGTTVATNAVFTGEGVPTGMITTKNFRDIYEIRRGFKLASMFNLFLPPYKPLIPRYLRIGVDERTLHSGEILTPLKEEEVAAAVDYLKGQGVQSIATVSYTHLTLPTNREV